MTKARKRPPSRSRARAPASPARANRARRSDAVASIPALSAADVLLVFTTVGSDDQANRISEELVKRGLAACVNILPRVTSVYRWKGKIWRDEERLLIAKTTRGAFETLRKTLRELHSYELPEVLAIAASAGDEAYLDWVREAVPEKAGK